MPRPSRERQILEAALSLFAENGYDGTSVRQIAERAEVTEAALYRHHESKQALAEALFRDHMTRYAARLQEIVERSDLSVEARLRAIVDASLKLYGAEPRAYAYLIQEQPRFMAALPGDFPYPIRLLEALLRAGQRDGTVRPGSTRVLAAIALGCFIRPIIISLDAQPETINPTTPATRRLIADATWSAIATPPRL